MEISLQMCQGPRSQNLYGLVGNSRSKSILPRARADTEWWRLLRRRSGLLQDECTQSLCWKYPGLIYIRDVALPVPGELTFYQHLGHNHSIMNAMQMISHKQTSTGIFHFQWNGKNKVTLRALTMLVSFSASAQIMLLWTPRCHRKQGFIPIRNPLFQRSTYILDSIVSTE